MHQRSRQPDFMMVKSHQNLQPCMVIIPLDFFPVLFPSHCLNHIKMLLPWWKSIFITKRKYIYIQSFSQQCFQWNLKPVGHSIHMHVCWRMMRLPRAYSRYSAGKPKWQQIKRKMNNIKSHFLKLNHFCYCNGILRATCIIDIRPSLSGSVIYCQIWFSLGIDVCHIVQGETYWWDRFLMTSCE